MRGLSSTFVGMGLLAGGVWLFMHNYSNTLLLGLLGAGLVLLYRGYQGLTIVEAADDAMLPAEFISNPRGAAIDLAVDRIGQLFEDQQDKAAAEQERNFDPDAIMARYLENRPAGQPASSQVPAAPRGFGRKGL